ncbi:gamma-glutamylcyclotransferase [Cupriavidus sp. 30B13]|uniref:gamma-glutamylcyclotransferase n=1 Tax=Cupriavidus sp. 30B13 TaxID=3384241 RepID=UPI003B8F22EB
MLTRDLMNRGDYAESLNLPEEMLWSQDALDGSLAAIMARRPRGGVWLFCYGSLMWNPLLHFEQRQVATLDGWHRSFCLRMTAGRGSPGTPGRMLSLEPGGSTLGVALRLPEATAEAELRLVWIREMVTGAYLPSWQTVTLADGTRARAIAFVANPRHPEHETDASVARVAPIVAAAAGPFGSNADYVHRLEAALAACGAADAYVSALAAALRRLPAATAR